MSARVKKSATEQASLIEQPAAPVANGARTISRPELPGANTKVGKGASGELVTADVLADKEARLIHATHMARCANWLDVGLAFKGDEEQLTKYVELVRTKLEEQYGIKKTANLLTQEAKDNNKGRRSLATIGVYVSQTKRVMSALISDYDKTIDLLRSGRSKPEILANLPSLQMNPRKADPEKQVKAAKKKLEAAGFTVLTSGKTAETPTTAPQGVSEATANSVSSKLSDNTQSPFQAILTYIAECQDKQALTQIAQAVGHRLQGYKEFGITEANLGTNLITLVAAYDKKEEPEPEKKAA